MAIESPRPGTTPTTGSGPTGSGISGSGTATPTAGSTGQPQNNRLADQLKTRASDALSQQKDRAAQGLGSIVEAVRSTGRQLGDPNEPGIAKYMNSAADSLQRWISTFEHKEIREIVEDVQEFGRRRPALFIGASFGAGLLGARFLKSSARDSNRSYRDDSWSHRERDTVARERDAYTAQRASGTVGGTTYGSSGNRT